MFKKWLSLDFSSKGEGKRARNFRGVLLLGCVGMAILLFSSFMQVEETDSIAAPASKENAPKQNHPVSTNSSMQQYETQYEGQLSTILNKIVGVRDASVIVNLDSSEEEVVAVDVRDSEQVTSEADKRGGNRSITQSNNDKKTAYYRTDNGDKPVIIKTIKPKVRGVLVVARGVENMEVKALVIEAVQRTLDVPIHRISVLPRG